MTSTKELFASGINYILRDIKDTEELLQTGTEYLQRVEGKLTPLNKEKQQRQIYKIRTELRNIKLQLNKHKATLKYYVEYFGYTDEDFKRLNLHPATDEEIKADYEQDMKEVGFDKQGGRGKYTLYEHNCLVQRVNQFNKEHDLPIVNF